MILNQNKEILIIFLFLSLFSIYQEISLITNDNIIEDNNEKLLFAWEHFRHGARDPYAKVDKKTWIDFIGVQWKSEGELNSIGLRSQYLLGIATKKRYENFLSKNFDINEIFIVSTDSNRTIVSAMANLQGIYKNYSTPNLTINQIDKAKIYGLNQTYKKKIDKKIDEMKKSYIQDGISIMPIHLFSKIGLQFKLNDKEYCSGATQLRNEALKQEEVKKIIKNFQIISNDTYGKYIFEFMNVSTPNYLFVNSNLHYICDTYIADYISGRDMPHIKRTGIDMDKFYNHCLNHSIITSYDAYYGKPPTKLSYLTVSPIFRTIFNYMDRRIKLNEEHTPDKIEPSSPKFVIYSGHDSTIAGMDIFLKTEFNIEYDIPEYTTSQLFELWQNKSGYFVKYLYNQKEKAVYELNDFKEKINKKILSENEVNDICKPKTKNFLINVKAKKKEIFYQRIFFIMIGFVFISIALLISVCILKRNNL